MNWSKASVIDTLSSALSSGLIADHLLVDYHQWQYNRNSVIDTIQQCFTATVIIRSSYSNEDSPEASHAGEYDSLLNVSINNKEQLSQAIDQVFASYPVLNDTEQILIQAMVNDIVISGVITTRTSPTAAPYYTINYQHSNQSTAITEGKCKSETVIIYRQNPEQLQSIAPECHSLLDTVLEVEQVLNHDALDIEFVIDGQHNIWILQARPITSIDPNQRIADSDIDTIIQQMIEYFQETQAPNASLRGHYTFYGNMPDINPAELIGARPRPLAFSLYRELITNTVCALARSTFGYRNLTLQPLLVSFAGQPYVDIRASFNTYLPDNLGDELSHKLIDYYLNHLRTNPELHDKVEFDVLITTINFDFHQRAQAMIAAGFSEAEVSKIQRELTTITNTTFAQCEKSLKLLDQLDQEYQRLLDANYPPLDLAIQLIQSAKQFGTLAFVEVARCGFAAVSFLQSMIRDNIANKQQVDDFMNQLHTVASDIQHDGAAVYAGDLNWQAFVNRYGHLRPGTYEITYPCYSDNPELTLQPMVKPLAEANTPSNLFEQPVVREYLQKQFDHCQFTLTVDQFARFLKQSIEAREYAKFLFTRNLSMALEAIATFGQAYGFSREDMAFIEFADLAALGPGNTTTDIDTYLYEHVQAGKRIKRIVNAIELPPLILTEQDITGFRYAETAPNYVTQQSVTAEVVKLTQQVKDKSSIQGKIILVPQADPGYDWIFAYDIAGLITQFGGVNSHMAIRCAELDIPAVIGLGKKHYLQIFDANTLCIDGLGKRLTIIN